MKVYAIYEAQFDGDGCEWMCIREDMVYLDKKQAEQKLEELKEQLDSVVREWEEYTELYKQALDEIEETLIPVCESCRNYYYNQHCEDCDTGYIKEIIKKAKED